MNKNIFEIIIMIIVLVFLIIGFVFVMTYDKDAKNEDVNNTENSEVIDNSNNVDESENSAVDTQTEVTTEAPVQTPVNIINEQTDATTEPETTVSEDENN